MGLPFPTRWVLDFRWEASNVSVIMPEHHTLEVRREKFKTSLCQQHGHCRVCRKTPCEIPCENSPKSFRYLSKTLYHVATRYERQRKVYTSRRMRFCASLPTDSPASRAALFTRSFHGWATHTFRTGVNNSESRCLHGYGISDGVFG